MRISHYYLLMLLTSFLWGGSFVFSKFLVGHATPITLTTLRWMIAVLVLLPIVWKKEKKLAPPRELVFPLLLMGGLGVAIFNIFQFIALENTTASNIGLISTLNPISIAIFSSLFLGERLKREQTGAMVISFVGIILVVTNGDVSQIALLKLNVGDLWMLLAVLIWGLYSISSKHVMKHLSPITATFYSGLFGVLLLLPFNFSSFQITDINFTFTAALIYTGVISTVVCMVLWNTGVHKLGPTSAGIFLNFNPIFTTILAYLVLNEKMSWPQAAGSLIVLLGCFLFSVSGRKQIYTKIQE